MGSGPKPPDPYQTAQAQQGMNYQTAQQNVGFSNANVNTPYGSSSYAQSGWTPVYDNSGKVVSYSPQYTQTIKLSPEEEALRQQNTQLRSNMGNLALTQSGQLQKTLGTPLSTSGMQGWTTAGAPGAIRQDQTPTDRPAIENAMMQMYHRQADPQNAAQDAQMAARGMNVGGQGYGQMLQSQQDALANAANQAYLSSGQESRAAQEAYNAATQQKYQMGADWASQLNNLRQAQLTEAIQLRDQPIKEMTALMSGSAPNTPQFSSFQGQQMSAPNLEQDIYNNYNARAQQYQNNLSGLFNLGTGALGMFRFGAGWSDRRLKKNIRRLDRTLAGVPLYLFAYKEHPVLPEPLWNTRHVGVMADEVAATHPDAVARGADGFWRVNYEILRMREAVNG